MNLTMRLRTGPRRSSPDGGAIAVDRVGRMEVRTDVSAGRQDDRIGRMRLDLASDQIPNDYPASSTVYDNDVQQLGTSVHLQVARVELLLECLIGPQEKLLAGLPAAVEGSRYQHASERTVREHAAVFTCEWDALCDRLIDDVGAQLGQPVDVGLSGAEIAALLRVVEEPVDAVAVLAVVLAALIPPCAAMLWARRGESWKQKVFTLYPWAARLEAAAAPASPVPTTITSYLRRLLGPTSFAFSR